MVVKAILLNQSSHLEDELNTIFVPLNQQTNKMDFTYLPFTVITENIVLQDNNNSNNSG